MKRHDHLSDQVLDVVVEEIPKIPAKTAMRLGARLYEVINRHLVARVAEDVPYATPAEQSAREEAVAFQHAAADAQLLATHRFNTARFDPPENPTTVSLDAAVRAFRVAGHEVAVATPGTQLRAGEPFRIESTPYMREALQEGLFDHTTTPSEAETSGEAREGAAPRRGRRSRGRKPIVRDAKVRLSKALTHFDRDANGRRTVTFLQLESLAAKIDLPALYVIDLLRKWRRVIQIAHDMWEIHETHDVITEWALELVPVDQKIQACHCDDIARACGLSPSTVRTWHRRRVERRASALKEAAR